MRVKLLKAHVAGCPAVAMTEQGRWSSPWYLTGEFVWRDRAGRQRASGNHTRFAYANCNATNCNAVALVEETFLCESIEHAVTQDVPRAKRTAGSRSEGL